MHCGGSGAEPGAGCDGVPGGWRGQAALLGRRALLPGVVPNSPMLVLEYKPRPLHSGWPPERSHSN